MVFLKRLSNFFFVLVCVLPLSVAAFQVFNKPSSESNSIKSGYRSGYISNEALPPDDNEKEQEKKQTAYEKFKSLKDYHSSSTGSTNGDKNNKPKLEVEIEEFYVEHEISERSARADAKKINISLLVDPAGCDECTHKDMEYCSGSQVISDHCCCDGKYSEVFPFVPHTCYLGSVTCRPIAADCGEYMRLRTCCCDKHLAIKWKGTFSKATTNSTTTSNLFAMLFLIAFGVFSSCLVLKIICSGQ